MEPAYEIAFVSRSINGDYKVTIMVQSKNGIGLELDVPKVRYDSWLRDQVSDEQWAAFGMPKITGSEKNWLAAERKLRMVVEESAEPTKASKPKISKQKALELVKRNDAIILSGKKERLMGDLVSLARLGVSEKELHYFVENAIVKSVMVE